MLAKHGDNARALGGGTTLVILMKQRALYYPYLVDLQTIPGLNEIKREPTECALALWRHIAWSNAPP